MRFQFDFWDIGAFLALAAVLTGLAFWHWPAALVALGCSFLFVYYQREIRLAPAPTVDRAGNGLPGRDTRKP